MNFQRCHLAGSATEAGAICRDSTFYIKVLSIRGSWYLPEGGILEPISNRYQRLTVREVIFNILVLII